MNNIYTPIEEAGELIRKRWLDKDLLKKVEDKFNGDIPEILKDGNCGMIWRQIGTPDMEFERFLELCRKANLKPVCFEYTEDKFSARSFTKYALTNLVFSKGTDKNLKNIVAKEKIIDFKDAEKKRICDLVTLWDENLVEFHHFFLQAIFPIMENRVIDLSQWIKRNKELVQNYYFLVLSFAVCHTVYFDDFDLLKEEDDFTNEIVLPAFKEVERYFGFKPIIVKISNIGEHEKDPYWWCYSKEAKIIMDNHIKLLKC